MITKTAKRILLALCAALAAVCVLFAISFKPTLAKASTTTSGLTEVTFDKVLPTNGVTDEGVTVDYLEFDGFGNNTWFMVEFTGRNAPSFAVNATQAYDTWNAQTTAEAGYLINNSREGAWGNLNITAGLNTNSSTGTLWRNYPTTGTYMTFEENTGTKLGLGLLSDTEKYVMIVGWEQTATSKVTFSYYLYSVGDDGTLTKDTVWIETGIGLSNAGGSKAVIYPNLYHETVRTTITFKYATPQKSLESLITFTDFDYKEQFMTEFGFNGLGKASLNLIKSANYSAGVVSNQNVDYVEFDGLSDNTYFLLDFVGRNAPNFAFNATQAYSTWNAEDYSTAGIMLSLSYYNGSSFVWGGMQLSNNLNTSSSHGNSGEGYGLGYLDTDKHYVMIIGWDKVSETDSTKRDIEYYLFSVDDTAGTLTKEKEYVWTVGSSAPSGDKAILYPAIGNSGNMSTVDFSYAQPAETLESLIFNLSDRYEYKDELTDALNPTNMGKASLNVIKQANYSSGIVSNQSVEYVEFDGFSGDTYFLLDFVGRNAPNFAFNATQAYSTWNAETYSTAGIMASTSYYTGSAYTWGTLWVSDGLNTVQALGNISGCGLGNLATDKHYIMIVGWDETSETTSDQRDIEYYLFSVDDTTGTLTKEKEQVLTKGFPNPSGDKAILYPAIGNGSITASAMEFSYAYPADTLTGVISNLDDDYAYKTALMNEFVSSYTVTVQNEKGEEITTASVKDGDTYTLPTSDIANFVAWEIDGKLYKAGTAITVTGDVTVKAVCFDFALEDGASIRISSTTEYHGGLRFTVKANTAQLTSLGATVYGFVLPTDSISGELDKTDATNATELENSVTDGDYTVYYITLTNVLYSNYNRAFSAMAYVELTLADETTMTVQTAYDAEKNSRCLYDIAVDAYNDTAEYSKYTSDQKKVVTDYINSTVNLIKIDDDTYQVATVEDGLTAEYVRGYTVVTSYDDANERLVFTITITIDSKLISTSDDLPHVPVTVWASDGNGGYVAERMSVTVQSYTDGVATLFFR